MVRVVSAVDVLHAVYEHAVICEHTPEGLVCAVLAGVAFFLGRHTTWARALAVAVVSLSAVAVFVGGGQAALAKYDRLPKVPNCGSAAEGSPPGALAAAAEFARLEHPAPFGSSWYGVDGCGSNILNVNFAEAADHYRAQLPATGWTITRDTSSELAASRGDLTFVLVVRCEQLAVEIKRAGTTSPNSC